MTYMYEGNQLYKTSINEYAYLHNYGNIVG